jgi:hypothetical protein
MKIHTGYYAKQAKYEASELLPISISRGVPKWASPKVFMKELAPSWDMLNLSESEYTIRFSKILEKQDPHLLYNELKAMADEHGCGGVVLMCYEKPDDFCHRHLVADWMNSNGYDVTEFGANITSKFFK